MTTVCLLLKAPREGLVKTRLAREIGAARATAIYRLLAERQIRAIPEHWPVRVAFAPSDARTEMESWLTPAAGRALDWTPQPEGDLGWRLAAAAHDTFLAGARQVILLGGDCPTLAASHLREAESALEKHDIAIAPSRDGGYVLLGLSREIPEIFENITWSTSVVLDETLARAHELGLGISILQQHEDIDDLVSLARYQAENPEGLLLPTAIDKPEIS